MGAAYFYHLTEQPLDVTLPMLVGKARQAGWRVLIRGVSESLLDRMDQLLWTSDAGGFLPHGLAGGPFDHDQPVLLALPDVTSAGFDCVLAIEGADITEAEVQASERVCIIFDGNDGAALARARDQWRALTKAGCHAQYWAQDMGRWIKKADTAS